MFHGCVSEVLGYEYWEGRFTGDIARGFCTGGVDGLPWAMGICSILEASWAFNSITGHDA